MVDEQGNQFQTQGVHALGGGYLQQQLQMHHQQQLHSFAHYGETDPQGGRVGAIWNKLPWEQVQGDQVQGDQNQISVHLNH